MKRILKIVAKTLIEYARIIAICFVACVIGAIFYILLGKTAYACYWIAVILIVIIRDITIKSKMQESTKIKLLLLQYEDGSTSLCVGDKQIRHMTNIDMHIDKLQTKLEVDQVTKTGKVTHVVLMDGGKNEDN